MKEDSTVALLVGCPVLLALVIVGWQAFAYLQSGSWPPFSINDALHWLTGAEWFAYPTSWHGLHSIMQFLNAGAGLIILAWATAITLSMS